METVRQQFAETILCSEKKQTSLNEKMRCERDAVNMGCLFISEKSFVCMLANVSL